MIPDGWTRESLINVAEIRTGVAKGKKNLKDPLSVPYLRVANVQDGRIDLAEIKSIEIERDKLSRYALRDGDVLMTEGGDFDKLGRGDVWKGQISPCVNQNHVFAVRVNRNRMLPYFLSSLSGSHYGKSYFLGCAKKSTNLASINSTQLKEFPVLIPPLAEQAKIEEILSTWDQAIKTTEELIENSKAQKKALMQQLLTGKKRLPEFSDEWSESILKNIAAILVSPVNKKSVAGEPSVRLCNYTDVYYNSHISNNLDFMTATASNSEVKRFTLKKNDLIITKDSETPEDIAVPALVSEELDNVVCGYHLAIIRPDTKIVEGAFLNHLFSQPKVRYYFSTRANGATRFGLTIDGIKEASFMLPGIDEQQKIASVLDACDRELRYLSIVAQKLTIEKRALMQQLLTGKRRVKVAA